MRVYVYSNENDWSQLQRGKILSVQMSRTALAIANPSARSIGSQLVMVRSRTVRRRVLLWYFIPPCVLFVVLACQLVVRVAIVRAGYESERLRAEVVEQDAKLRAIELDYAYLTRPQVLTSRADHRLGLRSPSPLQVRRLDGKRSVS